MHILHVTSLNLLDSHLFRGFLEFGQQHGLTQSLWTTSPFGTLHQEFLSKGGRAEAEVHGLLASAISLRRRVRRDRPDLVHAHLYRPSVIAALSRATRGPPLVLTRHYDDSNALRGRKRHVLADAFAANMADVVVAVSSRVAKGLLERERVRRDKITVIENGIDVQRFRPRKKVENTIDSRPILLAIAKADPLKGIGDLLSAFSYIRSTIPTATLWLCGVGVPTTPSDPGNGVKTLGLVRDIRPLLAAADLFVHPSWSEGFGLVVLEAIASGVRCVATDVGIVPEVLTPDLGEVVRPRDAQALRESILRQLSLPPVTSPPPFEGTKFDSRVMVRRYADVYGQFV